MKKFAITSIIALTFAAPVLAQTQLESSVGAQAGQYTLGELVKLKAAADSEGNARMVYLGNDAVTVSASNAHNAVATKIFAELADESRGSN